MRHQPGQARQAAAAIMPAGLAHAMPVVVVPISDAACTWCASSCRAAPPVEVMRHQPGQAKRASAAIMPAGLAHAMPVVVVPISDAACTWCASSCRAAPPVEVMRHQPGQARRASAAIMPAGLAHAIPVVVVPISDAACTWCARLRQQVEVTLHHRGILANR